jgi:hypothetical protein
MSDFVAVFDEFDAWEFYQLCIERVEDRVYCKEVAKLALDVQAGRPYAYGGKARLYVVLPNYRRIAVSVDGERRFVVIYLDIAVHVKLDVPKNKPRLDVASYVVALLYERCGDGFQLRSVDWVMPEIRAMGNPHPSAFFKQQ